MNLLVNAVFNIKASVGISSYITKLLPRLAELCAVTVVTSDPEVFPPSCRVLRTPAFGRSTSTQVLWSSTLLHSYCNRGYDALLCVTPAVPPATRLPSVATVHDLTPLEARRTHRARDKFAFWLGLQTIRRAHAVICDSHNTKRDLLRHRLLPPDRVYVVPLAPAVEPSIDSLNQTRLAPSQEQEPPYLLYVGGHARHKNLVRLLAAFSRLRVPPDTRLVIVGFGHGRQMEATRSAVTRLGLVRRVILLSNVPDTELSRLYRNCKLFVFPSLYEGFGLPVLEGLAHGAPVACSTAASLPEIAGDSAVYFNQLSVTDMAEKMQALLDNTKLASHLRKMGPKKAQQYSWDKTARRVHGVIVAAIRRGQGTPCS